MIKIKFVKDTEKFKKGEIAETTKKSSVSYIENGYAKYVNEIGDDIQEAIKRMNNDINLTEEISKGIAKLESSHFGITPEKFLEIAKKEKKVENKSSIKVKFLKDTEMYDAGKEPFLNPKDAKEEVDAGFAEYIISPEELDKQEKKIEEEDGKIVAITHPKETNQSTKELLVQELQQQEKEDYKEGEINWIDGDYWDSWDKVKGHMKKIFGNKDEYDGEPPEWFFLAHDKDKIRGKPQLIEAVQKKIPLIKLAIKKIKPKKNDPKYPDVDEDGKVTIQCFHLFDEKFDKRYDGYLKDTFSLYFYFYQIITSDEKRYFILTQKKLPNEICDFKGMLIEMSDFTEISRNLKIPTISGFFILKDCEPSIKILSKEEIVNYTKEKKINENGWLNFLAQHQLNTMNNFPLETEMLRSAFILSGKIDGWPLHLGVMGPPGTGKTMGHIETIGYKFEEEPRIAEGSGWTIKGLGPSFKQAIADIGYLAKSHRMGFIDEIGKMVEKEMNRHQAGCTNLLGDFNFLLEHKKRLVGSGNTGEVEAQATAKFLFVTNPIAARKNLATHIGAVDPTFMSRILWWVQDQDEQDLVLSDVGVLRVPPQPIQDQSPLRSSPLTHPSIHRIGRLEENRKKGVVTTMLWGGLYTRDWFLTLFDTCYNFLCEIDDVKVNQLSNVVTNLAKEPIKSSVWKPRAYHHVKLLIDGLCKHRCLFKDYDSSFVAKQEDYDIAERILIRMVNGWGTNLQPKEDI